MSRIAGVLMVLVGSSLPIGCGETHDDTDAGGGRDVGTRPDAPGADGSALDAPSALDCGPIGLPTCVQMDCCTGPVDGIFLPGTCTPGCPDGTVNEAVCEPAPGCGGGFDLCTASEECVLQANTCCGVCGAPELSDLDAIREDRRTEHFNSVCPEPMPCPECPTGRNPNLGATCNDASRCEGYDVRDLPLSECEVDSDCRLRVTDCCECGGDVSPFSLIAIRTDGESAYQSLVCTSDVICDDCAPTYPDSHQAYCRDSHCVVDFAPDSGG